MEGLIFGKAKNQPLHSLKKELMISKFRLKGQGEIIFYG